MSISNPYINQEAHNQLLKQGWREEEQNQLCFAGKIYDHYSYSRVAQKSLCERLTSCLFPTASTPLAERKETIERYVYNPEASKELLREALKDFHFSIDNPPSICHYFQENPDHLSHAYGHAYFLCYTERSKAFFFFRNAVLNGEMRLRRIEASSKEELERFAQDYCYWESVRPDKSLADHERIISEPFHQVLQKEGYVTGEGESIVKEDSSCCRHTYEKMLSPEESIDACLRNLALFVLQGDFPSYFWKERETIVRDVVVPEGEFPHACCSFGIYPQPTKTPNKTERGDENSPLLVEKSSVSFS